MAYTVDEVNRSGEIVIKGRRIICIRDYADGSRDTIYVEG